MTTRGKIGLLALAVAAAATGLGMNEIMSFAGCEMGAGPAAVCEEPSGLAPALLTGGIVAEVVGGIAFGVGLFVVPFVFLGIGVGSIAGGLADAAAGGRLFPLVFGGCFAAAALVPVAIGLRTRRKARRAQELVATGRKAIGTVVRVTDTGVTINNSPRVRIAFSIAPLDGTAPYEAEKTVTVSRLSIPRVGDRFPVWVDGSDPSWFAYGIPETEEARQRVRDEFGLDLSQAGTPTGPHAPEAALPAQAAGLESPAPGPATGAVQELERLAELRRRGEITDAEYAGLKAEVISEAIDPERT
jgi:hypothetical protein